MTKFTIWSKRKKMPKQRRLVQDIVTSYLIDLYKINRILHAYLRIWILIWWASRYLTCLLRSLWRYRLENSKIRLASMHAQACNILYIPRINDINTNWVIWILCELRTYKWNEGVIIAPNVWVFIAQLVEHCSANAEAMGSNPVEAPKTFFGLNLRLLKS